MNSSIKKLLTVLAILSLAASVFAVTPNTSFTPRQGVGYEEPRGNYYGTAKDPSYTFKSDEDTGIYRKGANSIGFSTGGVERTYIDSNGVNGKIGTITNSPTISSAVTNNPILTIQNTNPNAISGEIRAIKDSASPADGDDLLRITAYTDTDSSNAVEAAEILIEAEDVSTGSVDASVKISVMQAHTKINLADFKSTEIVFNEDLKDVDFRVENSTTINGLLVDAGKSAIGINKVPDTGMELDINGDLTVSGTANVTIWLDVDGTTQTDALRIDVAPSAYVTANSSHRVTVNFNGTDYWVLLQEI